MFRSARQIADNTDDRMGELNLDNVFWPRWVKNVLATTMVSQSWTYGTIRYTLAAFGVRMRPGAALTEIMPGVRLPLPGLEWNPVAMTNLAGQVIAQVGMNMIYQFIKTGQLPGDKEMPYLPAPWNVAMDMIAPRSGGFTKYGHEARVMLPG